MKAVLRRFITPARGGSMATDCITQVTFQDEGFTKPVVARCDQPDASTDGGLLLVKTLDTHMGLTAQMAACLDDARQPGKVLHETIELLQQRIFGICGGYADCNDAARLVHDPMHKLVLGRDPIAGLGLASQPTLSRFENGVSARELRAMTHVLADTVIAQQRRRLHGRATRITIDLDPTDDPTHGQQEFAFFNGHYDTWCYLPIVATLTFNDESAQVAVAAVLRPGKAPAGLGARGILRALLRKLRGAFPAARFRVRLDGGFASAKLFTFLEREAVEYVVAMASNRRLEKRARRLMGRARVLSRQTGKTAHLYGLRPLLPTGRRGEPAQRTAPWAGDGSDQLLEIPGQPVSGPARAGRLHPVAGAAAPRGGDRLRGRAGHDAARAADQARRVGRVLGSSHRRALAADLSVADHVAATRPRGRRHVAAAAGAPHRVTQGGLSLAVPLRCPALRPAMRWGRELIGSSPENPLPAPERLAVAQIGRPALNCVHIQ
jgi:hypothetical protein